jgi:hypothetical protein
MFDPVYSSLFQPPEPSFLRLGIIREVSDIERGGAQHLGNLAAISPTSRNLRSEGIRGDRRPQCDRGRVHQLVADPLDLDSSLLELDREPVEVGQRLPLRRQLVTPTNVDRGAAT